jgi:hypothetical protein
LLEINPEISIDLLPISERFLKHVEMKKELTNMSFMKNLEEIANAFAED